MLNVKKISASWKDLKIFSKISFTIEEGKTAAVLGPNGCGKTTLLSVIAGQKEQDNKAGTISLSGRNIEKGDRRIGCILQTYGIFPWLDVEKNIALPLRIAGRSRIEIENEINSALIRFNLSEHKKQYPASLSGGEKQKLALARTMVIRPQLLLMDEPFSAIDTLTREELQNFLRQLLSENRITTLIITHSIEEAVFLADQIHIMGKKPSVNLAGTVNVARSFKERSDPSFLSQVIFIRNILEGII